MQPMFVMLSTEGLTQPAWSPCINYYLRPAAAHRPPLLLLALRRGRRRDRLLSDLLLDTLHALAKVQSENVT